MKTIFVTILLAVTPSTQANEWTPLMATEGAVVTLEKPLPPAPRPTPDGATAQVGGPIDTYRDAKTLIDKGNALADRGKVILDQVEREGKITVDIRLPQGPLHSQTPASCSLNGTCRGSTCPVTPSQQIPVNSDAPSDFCKHCPGGVCPESSEADVSTPSDNGRSQPARRLFWRWRR